MRDGMQVRSLQGLDHAGFCTRVEFARPLSARTDMHARLQKSPAEEGGAKCRKRSEGILSAPPQAAYLILQPRRQWVRSAKSPSLCAT